MIVGTEQWLLRLGRLAAIPALAMAPLGIALGAEPEGTAGSGQIEEITVIGSRSVLELLGTSGSGSVVDAEALERTGALHINEVASRVPGIWISRGSGQEHLTAIRSAVLTGPGACGAFGNWSVRRAAGHGDRTGAFDPQAAA